MPQRSPGAAESLLMGYEQNHPENGVLGWSSQKLNSFAYLLANDDFNFAHILGRIARIA